MGLSNITAVSVCYGDYWEKFSQRWIGSVEAADPAPAGAILVTDVPRKLPAGFVNVVLGSGHMADFFNAGVAASTSEWTWAAGFDDEYLPDAFAPVESDADAIFFPHVLSGRMSGLFGYLGGFETMYEVSHNPMAGGCIHRTSLLREMPFRRFGYFDWTHFSEMAWFGKRIEFTDTPRQVFHRHDGAHSMNANHDFIHEVHDFNARLRAGAVQMGVPE